MAFSFELSSVLFEVEYRKVKVLRLTVYPPDGRVKITAPSGATADAIKKFAASKIGWIEKHRERFQSHSKQNKLMQNQSTVYVWGEAYELELIERTGNSKVVIEGKSLKLYARPGSSKLKRQEILDRWYRRILNQAAPDIIKKWEKLIGVEVKKLYLRKMKTHWGSCNYEKQTLRLNSELAKRNPVCLEYVVVHEMLHIIEKGHNRKFYLLLGKYMPDWKNIRKKLNSGEW